MRNIVVHQYFAISWETVWWTTQGDVLELEGQLVELIEELDTSD